MRMMILLFVLHLVLLLHDTFALKGESNVRVRRAYSPSNYPYFYYNAPFFPTAELSSQQLQFYGNNARNQIPFNKASNLYYNIPYGYRGYENVRNDATLRQYHGKGRRNLRYYGFNKVVGGNKRTFHQDIKVKTKLGPIKNKGNISLESHSDVPEMINIPFKTSRARLVNKHPIKATTAKSTVQLKVQKSSWNEEKERVEKKNTTLTQGLNAGFIVPIAVRNTARKTLKSNTTHDTKVVNEIIDEISSDKLKSKNVSTAYDQITSHPILLGNKDHQTTYKRNTTTSHQSPHSEKKSANATTTSKTRSSTNHTVNAQTKNVLKNIKNGLQKTWQGIKNFTTYLTAPNKNKEKPPSKQPQLWKAPSIKHDAAKQDWFGIEVEPDAKTQNDLKISKSKFFTELVKTKMTEKPDQVAKSKDSKKDSENHVKKLVDLVEASEHEELKNIVQDSVGSPLKGELKRIPLSKENMKNVEKEKNAYIGATESNEINKLITNYKDDFDVFVDKSINKESDADSTQPKGEVLTAPRKLDTDVQFDNSLAFSNDVNEDVTGKRKNGFHNSNVGEDIPPDEVTSQLDELSSVAQKWQLIKEANKQIFDEGKKHLALEENQSKLDNSAESKDNINNETGESKVLNQYFSQIENKENVDQSKQFENKQNKRRQKINATLTMLSDIEHQIDGIIKDRGNSDESYMQNFQMPMKGRATIFQELVNGENSKEGVSAGAMEEDGNLVRPESEEELRNEDTDRSRSYKMTMEDKNNFAKNKETSMPSQRDGVNNGNDGQMIDNAVTSSDNVDHILQAKALKNIQDFEMNNDLQRMKEVTQNGLREMFGTAVNKQQMFIDQVQGRDTSTTMDENQIERSPQQELMPSINYQTPETQTLMNEETQTEENSSPPYEGRDFLPRPDDITDEISAGNNGLIRNEDFDYGNTAN